MSEETICFSASVYENGVRVGEAKNEGRGGETYIYVASTNFIGFIEMDTLIEKVDELLYAYYNKKETEKFEKKIASDSNTGVCYGTIEKNTATYNVRSFKVKRPLSYIVTLKGGLDAVQSLVNDVKANLKAGEAILNKNLKSLGIKI